MFFDLNLAIRYARGLGTQEGKRYYFEHKCKNLDIFG
jgi:hypothetical protein